MQDKQDEENRLYKPLDERKEEPKDITADSDGNAVERYKRILKGLK